MFATVLLTAGAGRGGEPAPAAPGWSNAAAAKGYGEAAAHDPRFADRALWPKLTGKEYFLKAAWPGGRLYVWAHPGKNGGKRFRGLEVTDPKNWLVGGKPAAELVLDENADILLPASQTPYSVGFRGTSVRETVRHVTVQPGAAFVGGGDGVGRTIYGNVWVKKGGGIDAQGATRLVGGRHTFFRNDNLPDDDRNHPGSRKGNVMCSQYFVFNKEAGASVEFLGHVSVLDEFRLHGGLVIVGADSVLQPGRNAVPEIAKDGTLALLDGARFGKWLNQFRALDIIVGGTVQGGLPDRPLTRDCHFTLGYKNSNGTKFYDTKVLSAPRGGGMEERRAGMVVLKDGRFRVFSTDLSKATLVVEWHGLEFPVEWTFKYHRPNREEVCRFVTERLKRIPRKIVILFEAGATVEGVRLDHVAAGGLLFQEPSDRSRWKDVTYGGHNAGPPDALFGRLGAGEITRHTFRSGVY